MTMNLKPIGTLLPLGSSLAALMFRQREHTRWESPAQSLLFTLFTALLVPTWHDPGAEPVNTAPQWQEVQLSFAATRDTANPYTDTEAWADFTHDDGTKTRRPMFWDGGRTFRVRFASTKSSGKVQLPSDFPVALNLAQ